ATGKPVVSVRNAEIEKFARWVHIADGREDFLAGLERALRDDSPAAAAARMAAVADQTWDRRVDAGLDTVRQALARRTPLAESGAAPWHAQPRGGCGWRSAAPAAAPATTSRRCPGWPSSTSSAFATPTSAPPGCWPTVTAASQPHGWQTCPSPRRSCMC